MPFCSNNIFISCKVIAILCGFAPLRGCLIYKDENNSELLTLESAVADLKILFIPQTLHDIRPHGAHGRHDAGKKSRRNHKKHGDKRNQQGILR
jgi:hypothetical protein